MTTGPSRERVPRAAALLGGAGLLPVVAAILLAVADGGPGAGLPIGFGIAYGALILSFLGGIWWGVASARLEGAGQARLLATAVMPSILAAAILCALPFDPRAAGGLMGAAIVATLLGDRWLQRAALVPGWWLRLRVPLSVALGAGMIVLALLA